MNHYSPFALTFFLISLYVFLVFQTNAAPTTSEAKQQSSELAGLRQRIGNIESALKDDHAYLDEAQTGLRRWELEVAETLRLLTNLDAKMNVMTNMLNDLRAEQFSRENAIRTHKAALARQLRLAYMSGHSERLKLLLNQEDPVRIGRVLRYHEYFGRARSIRISRAAAKLEELDVLKRTIKLESANLAELKAETDSRLQQFQTAREERATIVATLQSRIVEQRGILEKLKGDEKRLTALIDELGEAISTGPPPQPDARPFADLVQQLNWPVDGKITRTFGTVRDDKAFTWQGVVLEAPAGTTVRAISGGRVIFADWFQHLGLLLIIDHGLGYMSLYGHNQTLFKDVGDWVVVNEIIAGVGDSGGRNVNALYFEVRHEGIPQDPARWCQTKDG